MPDLAPNIIVYDKCVQFFSPRKYYHITQVFMGPVHISPCPLLYIHPILNLNLHAPLHIIICPLCATLYISPTLPLPLFP